MLDEAERVEPLMLPCDHTFIPTGVGIGWEYGEIIYSREANQEVLYRLLEKPLMYRCRRGRAAEVWTRCGEAKTQAEGNA